MPFRFCRRFIATITAALFMLSAVLHHVVVAGMSAEAAVAMAAAADEMPSHDNMPCPMSSDCSRDMSKRAMACFAHCAIVLGILAEPTVIPVSITLHRLDAAVDHSLASLHGPPEPPPPKSHV